MIEKPKFYTAKIENVKIIDIVELKDDKNSLKITAQNPEKEILMFTTHLSSDAEKYKVGDIGTLVVSISNEVVIGGIPGTNMGEIKKEEIVLHVEDFVPNENEIKE